MNASTIVAVIGLLGGATGIGTLFLIWPQLRKLQQDTRKVEADTDLADADVLDRISSVAERQMNAALARADHAESEVAKLRVEVATLHVKADDIHKDCQDRIGRLEDEMRQYRETAQRHVVWDVQRIADLTRLGMNRDDIPDAPPLLPRGTATRYDRT